ncbi:MAG TPA: hypothetical protein VF613_15745 [Longimicrobium sp.]|jgi:hypothetical protein
MSDKDVFAEANRLSDAGIDEYRILNADTEELVLIGSFDLAYYHDVEIAFRGVRSTDCPETFHSPRFREDGGGADARVFEIDHDEGSCRVVAHDVTIRIGKVYHYDRGASLAPGERIAPWVTRNSH